MSTTLVPIHISLVALRDGAQRELQKLVDVLRYHRSASAAHSQHQFDEYLDFFSVQPSQNAAMGFAEARAAAESLTLLHVLRDAIDFVNAFLDPVFHACLLYSLARHPAVTIESFAAVEKRRKAFHRFGLPKKILMLRDEFGVESDF